MLKTEKQVEEFISTLSNSMCDNRTLAEILEDDDGASILRSGTGYGNIP
ncbi:hypothetical protein JK636_18745 [Clostridium sp. YIM B02515]|uniref:Nif11 domain-containing protein n=1 Tax=Clostridium rhizosphaerae TaxID=2803861 RepID=A0ABS1TG47_9CLOT|nr:hypothetical protein [Clostridium rhizosphaerae]